MKCDPSIRPHGGDKQQQLSLFVSATVCDCNKTLLFVGVGVGTGGKAPKPFLPGKYD